MKYVFKQMLWKFVAQKLFQKWLKKSYKRRTKWDKSPRHRYQSPLPWGYGAYEYYPPKYPKYHKSDKRSGWKKQAARYIAQTMRRRLGAR